MCLCKIISIKKSGILIFMKGYLGRKSLMLKTAVSYPSLASMVVVWFRDQFLTCADLKKFYCKLFPLILYQELSVRACKLLQCWSKQTDGGYWKIARISAECSKLWTTCIMLPPDIITAWLIATVLLSYTEQLWVPSTYFLFFFPPPKQCISIRNHLGLRADFFLMMLIKLQQ